MSNNEGKICTVVLNHGAELIAKVVSQDMMKVVLYRPRLLTATANGIGLMDSVAMSAEKIDGELEINLSGILYIVPTAKQLADGWTSQTSGIAIPTPATGSGLIS